MGFFFFLGGFKMNIEQFLDSLGYHRPRHYPLSSKKMLEFKQESYNIYFVKELERYICENYDRPVYQTILEFRNKMEDYSCIAQNPEIKWMYAVGYDVANYALERVQNGSCIV